MNNIIKSITLGILVFMSFFGQATVKQLIPNVKNDIKNTTENFKTDKIHEIDFLTLSVRTVWEDNIKTVGQAVQYIIEPSDYKLIVDYPAPSDAAKIASNPIPAIAKLNRTMPIIDVVQILIGTNNTIIVDHEHKLISFQKGAVK